MKSSFWIFAVSVLVYVAALASCGPKHRYCPSEMDMECHVYDDGGRLTGTGGTMDNGPCDGGAISVGPDGSVTCL